MLLIVALRVTAAFLSLAGEGDEAPLPRSLVDAYVEPAERPESQDDPSQDPLQPPLPPRKEDFAQKPREEPLLEHAHDSIGGFFRTHWAGKAWEDNVWRGYLSQPPVLVPVGLAAGAGIVSPWDKPLSRRIAGTLGDRPWIGDATMASLAFGSVALGMLLPGDGRNSWDNFWEEAEVFAVTGLLTSSLKLLVGRTRPGGGNRSFPSGHTSAAFAAATLIDANSDGSFGVPAYGLAALTGYSRMEARRHYPSDVLAGAAIGILSAQILDHLHWGNGRDVHGIAGGGPRLELEPLDRGAMIGTSFRY